VKSKTSKAQTKPDPNHDAICGIDRYEHSGTRGLLTVKMALLYREHDKPFGVDNISGILAHGARVKVIKDIKAHCLIEELHPPDDQLPQRGWIRRPLLERRGLEVAGQKAIEK